MFTALLARAIHLPGEELLCYVSYMHLLKVIQRPLYFIHSIPQISFIDH